MFAVVALHCTRVFTLGASESAPLYYAVSTALKFATIGFFLVSGFLLHHDLERHTNSQLLHKRLRKVLLPWIFWCALYIASIALSDLTQNRGAALPGESLPAVLFAEAIRSLTATSLWFVPNLLAGLAVLLLFRRRLDSLAFGAALLAANLFYTANIYAQWIAPNHTRAVFAFVFYLWLGRFAAAHLPHFAPLVERIATTFLLALTLLAAAGAFAEARLLLHLHSVDPLNTLRLSNQLFSILAVLCLAKLGRRTWPRFVDVPRHIFGIYLSHALIVGLVLTAVRRLLELPAFAPIAASLTLRFAHWLAATSIAWTAGWLLARRIAATPALCWMQGLSRPSSIHVEPSGELPEGAALFIG